MNEAEQITVACIDLAGTTVADDDDAVRTAFAEAIAALGIVSGTAVHERALARFHDARGGSTFGIFRSLFDEPRAQAANLAFERSYDQLVDRRGLEPVPGADDALSRIRAAGIGVCLLTGFGRRTQAHILDALDWWDRVDLTLGPEDVRRDRPWPDLVLTAALRLGVDDVRDIAVCADTATAIQCGRRSGASLIAGVRTGWRDRDPAEAPPGVKPVIRLKAPQTGETVIEDHVQGRVVFANSELDDLVLLRSDGSPTYMLSVVVDDYDMDITHVIRGDDHLTNAARQRQIYDALGWGAPDFAHIPLIHGPDGAKLSKRHGALGVEAYRDMGYLPEAMRNYLVRLGWSHGDEEIISTEQMIAWFDLDSVGRSPARFDFVKLENLNGYYVRHKDDAALVEDFIAFLPRLPEAADMAARLDAPMRETLLQAMPGLKERAKTLVELVHSARFLFAERPLALDDKAAKILSDEARATLTALIPALEAVRAWSAAELEAAVRAFAEENGLKLGQVAQPLRAALTGTGVSPGIFDVLAVLGREEALARLADQAA